MEIPQDVEKFRSITCSLCGSRKQSFGYDSGSNRSASALLCPRCDRANDAPRAIAGAA